MSEAKHTDGPWGDISGQGKMRSIRAQGKTIAEAVAGDSIEEIEANARLIAAAPEMLATLRKLEYWLDTDPEVIEAMPGDERRDHMAKLGMIREVIAKAEGRS